MEPILRTEHLFKEFGATKAIVDVDFELFPGEVRGLIGENGSGKSTLSNMITGVYRPTSGKIFLRGKEYEPKTILDSRANGIALLAQEMGTISGMTVAENMFLGEETVDPKKKIVSLSRLRKETKKILTENGFDHIQPGTPVDYYSFEDRKMIEVARAMYAEPDILIVDETTTALSQKGREKIYEIIKKMKEDNKSVIFISHDLDEILSVCDCVTVLRDGHYVDTLREERLNKDTIREMMIGREFEGSYYRNDTKCTYQDNVVLKAEHLYFKHFLQDVSLELHAGEILGIGGLTECGMHELLKVLFGVLRPDTGEVTLPEKGIRLTSPQASVKNKVAYLAKDRDRESLFIASNIRDNITSASLPLLEKGPFIFPRSEKKMAKENADALSVKMQDVSQQVSELSGGNKQKVAICKWLANESEILLIDCPTRGIDIGVKANIYRLLEQLKEEGRAILMVSEELTELIGLSDRILIMKNGEISGTFLRDEQPTESAIIRYMV